MRQDLFPFCPQPPAWHLDWTAIQQQFSWLRAMAGVMQEPDWHGEGDVLIHTGMVVAELIKLAVWRNLPAAEREMVFAAALLHDIAKPRCTRIDAEGHITSRGHAREGERMARRILWSGEELPAPLPFVEREQIAHLVRLHGLPLHFLDKPQPEKTVIAASMSTRLDLLALLAEADVRGRICADQQELLDSVTLFREFSQEQQCYTTPRQFASDYSRFIYFQSERGHPEYSAYDDTVCEVVMMAGLPGVGKDSWIARHYAGWPVVSLDVLRAQLKISPEESQGTVVQAAREQARVYLRKHQSFVWNATNVTKTIREQLISLFTAYKARVRIVYLDAALETILFRNSQRAARVPESVIWKLLDRLEVPDATEAHQICYEQAEL